MPSNDFTKQELVLWEKEIEGFEDAEVMAKNVDVMSDLGAQAQERSGDIYWVPQPSIAKVYDGIDQSANFNGQAVLAVPVTIGYEKSHPFSLTAKEARDQTAMKRLMKSGLQAIASSVNKAILDTITNTGSLFVKRTTAASGFDDIAEIDSMMNEQGVPDINAYFALSSRDYNSAASNLAARQTLEGKAKNAYEKAYIGQVSNFDGFKLDYTNNKTLAGGSGITIDTRASAVNYYTPVAKRNGANGERSNVDNRHQTITVSSTTNVASGDAFTIANWQSVHHISKVASGQLKTHRVVSIDSGTTMTITPPIVSGQGGTNAELQYQNGSMTATSATAAIVFLNTTTSRMNPFWTKDSVAIVPSKYQLDAGAGWITQEYTTSSGITVAFSKQSDINTLNTKYRLDALFGTANLNTEMNGVIMFGQA